MTAGEVSHPAPVAARAGGPLPDIINGFILTPPSGEPSPSRDVRDEQCIEVYLTKAGAARALAELIDMEQPERDIRRARLELLPADAG